MADEDRRKTLENKVARLRAVAKKNATMTQQQMRCQLKRYATVVCEREALEHRLHQRDLQIVDLEIALQATVGAQTQQGTVPVIEIEPQEENAAPMQQGTEAEADCLATLECLLRAVDTNESGAAGESRRAQESQNTPAVTGKAENDGDDGAVLNRFRLEDEWGEEEQNNCLRQIKPRAARAAAAAVVAAFPGMQLRAGGKRKK